jgi:diguanylate cyclase (GGDEF)-like protein
MHVPTASRPRRIALWASVLLAVAFIPVQAAEATRGSAAPGSNVRFQRLTIDEGLAQNSVLSVLQDRTGYIWLATEDGLHRYDGYGFTIFRNDPADPASLSENNIFTLLEARDGSLWVGTYNGGLSRYDPQAGSFTRYPVGAAGQGLSHGIVYSLAEDRSGAIWVGTEGGLDRIEPATGKVQRFPVGAQGTRHARIWALTVDAADRVWVGTHAGLDLYDPTTGAFTAVDGGGSVKLDKSINAIAQDRSGQVWVSTENGVVVFDRDLKRRAEYAPRASGGVLPSGRVRAILAGRSGQVWLGTIDAGLLQLDPATGRVAQFRHDPSDVNSLSDDAVVSLFEDQGGVLWVGTEAQGVNRFNPATQRFQHWKSQPGNPDSLPARMVWSVREARDGGLWVGTDAGLARIDRRTGKHRIWRHDARDPKSLASDYVPALFEDDAGTQWIGTNRGLQRVRSDGSLERVSFKGDGEDDTLYLNSITAFARGAEGRVWLGTSAGLIDYDPRSGDSRRVRSITSDAADAEPDYVLALTPARDGGLWVGTEKGLTHLGTDGKQRRWTEGVGAGGLAHATAQALAEDAEGRLWIGTSVGLDRLDPSTGNIEHLTTAQGLPNNTIYTLVFGADGGLWMTTNRGLARLDPTSRAVRSWVVEDGLQSNEFNGGVGYASPSGWLFFGGINGVNAFRPGDLVDREFVPSAAITQVDLIDRSLSLSGALARDRQLTLGHTDPVLTFQFAVFDYAAPSKNSFRFMLEGFDTDWRESGSRNHVTYTNLDPGEYRFRLLGANTHGTWSEQEAVLSITVLPPPWRTWWAYAGYALAVLLAVALVARAHHAKVRHDHQLLAEQQKRRWSETLHQLSQSLASSLDAQQIAELLMDSLRRMLNYRTAALYVEQGVEVQLVGARGLNDEQVKALRQLPEARARLFAEIRHRREPLEVDSADLRATPLAGEPGAPMHYLAIPTFSRSEEFALLLVGRSDSPFTAQEKEIAAAVARQALVALDNARLFAELQNLATTDNLTKVNNRRYFFELAELEFARSRRYGRNLAVILLDADEFTVINEQYGHEVGDRVLRLIASTCRANLRHFDIIGRYGGEDFVIMLPETPLNVAADVADRLRKAIDGLVIETHKGELRVTVSLGVALADAEVADLATLINRADMALYEAKRSGRNRVVVAEQH